MSIQKQSIISTKKWVKLHHNGVYWDNKLKALIRIKRFDYNLRKIDSTLM